MITCRQWMASMMNRNIIRSTIASAERFLADLDGAWNSARMASASLWMGFTLAFGSE